MVHCGFLSRSSSIPQEMWNVRWCGCSSFSSGIWNESVHTPPFILLDFKIPFGLNSGNNSPSFVYAAHLAKAMTSSQLEEPGVRRKPIAHCEFFSHTSSSWLFPSIRMSCISLSASVFTRFTEPISHVVWHLHAEPSASKRNSRNPAREMALRKIFMVMQWASSAFRLVNWSFVDPPSGCF